MHTEKERTEIINEKEINRLYKFKKKHTSSCNALFSLVFKKTSIEDTVEKIYVRCEQCGKTKEITDYGAY